MAAICQLFRKCFAVKSANLRICKTVLLNKTWCRSFKSEFYRKHSLETLAEKKRLLGLEDSPEIIEKVDIEESTTEWKYVERLLPLLTVPITKSAENHNLSVWEPPADQPPNLPYYVRRQRSQLLPVYLELKSGQTRILTKVRYIEGDIWALEQDLRSYLEDIHKRIILTQVHEVANFIRFKGDHVIHVRQWLLDQGF